MAHGMGVSRFWDRASLAVTAFLALCFALGLASMGGCDVRSLPVGDEVFCVEEEPVCTAIMCQAPTVYCCREFYTSETDCWTE